MTTSTIRLKLTSQRLSARMKPRYPVALVASSPLLLSNNNGTYAFSLDMNAIQASFLSLVISIVGLTQRVVTAAGAVAVSATDNDIIIIKKTVGAPTTVNLPTSASRLTQPQDRTAIRIVDGKYDAATNNITIVPNGAETIAGGASYIIDSNGGSITLTPLSDGSGWV